MIMKLKFNNFREVFCWIDKWYHLTMNDICEFEKKAIEELKKQFINEKIIGMKATEP